MPSPKFWPARNGKISFDTGSITVEDTFVRNVTSRTRNTATCSTSQKDAMKYTIECHYLLSFSKDSHFRIITEGSRKHVRHTC
jgi:hypothetical protein